MSIETLTGDEFMHLDADTHRVALTCYDQVIDEGLHNTTRIGISPSERTGFLDKLTSLLQLRKLHKVRLAELEEEEQPAALLASAQYQQNELAPTA